MYEPNTIIRLGQNKSKNKIYMIDVTSREIYAYDTRNGDQRAIAGIGVLLGVIFTWAYEDYIYPHLYLSNIPFIIKVLMILVGIFIMIAMLKWGAVLRCFREMRYAFKREEFFQRYPHAEKVCDEIEVNRAKKKGAVLVTIQPIVGMAFLGAAVYMFCQFLNYSNLGMYFFALVGIIMSSVLYPGFKRIVFILKLKRE